MAGADRTPEMVFLESRPGRTLKPAGTWGCSRAPRQGVSIVLTTHAMAEAQTMAMLHPRLRQVDRGGRCRNSPRRRSLRSEAPVFLDIDWGWLMATSFVALALRGPGPQRLGRLSRVRTTEKRVPDRLLNPRSSVMTELDLRPRPPPSAPRGVLAHARTELSACCPPKGNSLLAWSYPLALLIIGRGGLVAGSRGWRHGLARGGVVVGHSLRSPPAFERGRGASTGACTRGRGACGR